MKITRGTRIFPLRKKSLKFKFQTQVVSGDSTSQQLSLPQFLGGWNNKQHATLEVINQQSGYRPKYLTNGILALAQITYTAWKCNFDCNTNMELENLRDMRCVFILSKCPLVTRGLFFFYERAGTRRCPFLLIEKKRALQVVTSKFLVTFYITSKLHAYL